jgi:chemotaxis methyl-accepting protein methylase
VVHALCQAVSVGETFFFRHPDQFLWVTRELVPELVASSRSSVRAWSAGCATGEEAYSLAACLLDSMPPGLAVEVLGTDLLERNLAIARRAVYGAWSCRASGPQLHRVLHEDGSGKRCVDERVRSVTRFELHNLLDSAPARSFDLIFCRNVLVYFSPAAARGVVRHLIEALAPSGALLFGPMDLAEVPAGLARCGAPELQIYRRPTFRAAHERPPPAPKDVAAHAVPRPAPPPEPVALHLRALVHIERGERKRAEKELSDLARQVPDYVPGILERALLHVRMGEKTAATALMREVLKRIDKLPADEVLAGPEPLPVSFYRDSAQTYLRSARGGLE